MKKKLLLYIKVECMCDEKFMVPFQKQQKKERDKLISNTFKKNTGKLIEDRGSNLKIIEYWKPNPASKMMGIFN